MLRGTRGRHLPGLYHRRSFEFEDLWNPLVSYTEIARRLRVPRATLHLRKLALRLTAPVRPKCYPTIEEGNVLRPISREEE